MLSNVITLILLVLLNAFFAATEMAFISVNDNKIKIMVSIIITTVSSGSNTFVYDLNGVK